MSDRTIVRALGVSDETATNALFWVLRHTGHSRYRASRTQKTAGFGSKRRFYDSSKTA